MDVAELRELLSPEGLRLLDQVGPIGSTADVVRIVSRLRADGHSGTLVAAVLGQARLRAKAVPKFGEFAGRMLFTPEGLEQATRLRVAACTRAGSMRRAWMSWPTSAAASAPMRWRSPHSISRSSRSSATR